MNDQNNSVDALFEKLKIGEISVQNRILMAPLTRNRAGAGNVPTPLMVEYYAQRAGAGAIISEATQICPEGQGYLATPGIHSEEQINAWKKITEAVHQKGGKIILQLWHVGRISHVELQPDRQAPVAPSAIQAQAQTYISSGFVDVSMPRALSTEEIKDLVQTYRQAARNAMDAGFDGVEVHAANGYLIDQFLRDGSNHRQDAYGGSIENRTRFLIEIIEAVVKEIGAGRVGVRISPVSPFNDMQDSDPQSLFNYVIEKINPFKIAYVHIIEGETGGNRNVPFDYQALRKQFDGKWIVNNGYTRDMAIEAIHNHHADAIAFGRPYIANPDLTERFKRNASLNEPDPGTFYGGDQHGYTDYPSLP